MNKKCKILLVDDNAINLRVASIFLTELGFKNITVAENGLKALEIFDDSFDLVLLDIGLPDIDGQEVCRIMRERMQIKTIPIIAVTAFSEDMHEKLYQAGINDVIHKPIDMTIFTQKMKKWTSQDKKYRNILTNSNLDRNNN